MGQTVWSLPNVLAPPLTVGYFTEYNQSSFFSAKHVYTNAKRQSFIGHEIMLSVSVNRSTRKTKKLSTQFKAMTDKMWQEYPQKEKYFILKHRLLAHLEELKEIRMNDDDAMTFLFSYKMQLRFFDEDRNH